MLTFILLVVGGGAGGGREKKNILRGWGHAKKVGIDRKLGSLLEKTVKV